MIKIILIPLIMVVLALAKSSQARDPDVLPYDHGYGERMTVSGSQWTGGDTFLCITLPLVVLAVMLLPHIFDGKCLDWPVYKFKNALSGHLSRHNVQIKFPTRRLCVSY